MSVASFSAATAAIRCAIWRVSVRLRAPRSPTCRLNA